MNKKILCSHQTIFSINKHHVLRFPNPRADGWGWVLVVHHLLVFAFLHQLIQLAELSKATNRLPRHFTDMVQAVGAVVRLTWKKTLIWAKTRLNKQTDGWTDSGVFEIGSSFYLGVWNPKNNMLPCWVNSRLSILAILATKIHHSTGWMTLSIIRKTKDVAFYIIMSEKHPVAVIFIITSVWLQSVDNNLKFSVDAVEKLE